jgi:hypothetical protein
MIQEDSNENKFSNCKNWYLCPIQSDKVNEQDLLNINYLNTRVFDSVTGEECSFSDNRKAKPWRISEAMLTSLYFY